MMIADDDTRGEELAKFIIANWPHNSTSRVERDHLLQCLAMNAGCALAPQMLEQGREGVRREVEEFVGIMLDTMEECARGLIKS
jgi:hypothetical protein